MIKIAKKLKGTDEQNLKKISERFNNKKNIQLALNSIIKYTKKQKKEAFIILRNSI